MPDREDMWTVEDWEKMVRVLGEIIQERSDKRGKHNDSTGVRRRRPIGKGLKKYSTRAGGGKVPIGVARESV
ncbi:MAG: hypothetical protein ACETWE_01280 [Candidatus Bathyarchaeia archaeon]